MRPLLLLCCLVSLAACRPGEGQLSPDEVMEAIGAQTQADAIEADLARFAVVRDTLRDGDGDAPTAAWAAYFAGDSLVLVEEHLDLGAAGSALNRFFFQGDSLVAYRGERRLAATDPNRPGQEDEMRMALLFTSTGQVLRGKEVNGRKNRVEDSEVVGARRRAQTLRTAALATRSAGAAARPAPDGLLRGYYAYGQEANTFQPCDDTAKFWVTGAPDVVQRLEADHRRLAEEPYAPLYAEVRGSPAGRATEGHAAQYAALLFVDDVVTVRPRRADDCPLRVE